MTAVVGVGAASVGESAMSESDWGAMTTLAFFLRSVFSHSRSCWAKAAHGSPISSALRLRAIGVGVGGRSWNSSISALGSARERKATQRER